MTVHFAHASGGSEGRWGKNAEGFRRQIRRQLSYERPEYAMHVPNSLNAGMSFRIAF